MIKLASSRICPFVQRAVFMLREKDVDFEVEYIDLRNKPAWLLELSPRGQVPLLQLESGEALFESQAIVEYIDEVFGEPLMPADPVARARDRAWFMISSDTVFSSGWRVESSRDEETLQKSLEQHRADWRRIDEALEGRDWLSGAGARLGFADVGFVSALYRARHFEARYGLDAIGDNARVRAWSERMHARPSMARSVPEDWDAAFDAFVERWGSILAAHG